MAKAKEKIKVTFLENRVVFDENDEPLHEFKEGQSYDLNPASAQRWLRRGVAQLFDEKAEKERQDALEKAKEAEQNGGNDA